MVRGRWSRGILAAGLVLIGTLVSAGPAGAAPCTGPSCYRLWSDISVEAWTTPLHSPIAPGSFHSYTARVTNTGWRTGGNRPPTPWPGGPASGTVHVSFEPSTPDDVRLGCQSDTFPMFLCFGGYNYGLAFDCGSIPPDTTWQFTVFFRAPLTSGTYSMWVWIYPFQGANPWTEYNPDNNEVTLTYQVGRLY